MTTMNMNNKVALITGAGSGIGEAIALAMYQAGAQLILVGRDQNKLSAMRNRHQLDPARVILFSADLNKASDRQRLLSGCEKLKNPVSILVNNAGVSDFSFVEHQDEAMIENIVQTNLLSPMLLVRAFIPLLKKSASSVVVNVGSTFGSIGYPGFSAYCASKFGMRGFSQAMRRELANTSIDVCYVAPRATRTAINSDAVSRLNQELGNAMDEPTQVAQQVLKAIITRKAETYIGWPEKLFVKINAILPSVVDGSLIKQLPIISRYAQ